MKTMESNEIDSNWVTISTADHEFCRGTYYMAIYINEDNFLKTLMSIRSIIDSEENSVISGKIIFYPKNESFKILLLHGDFLDMVKYARDREDKVKRSKVKLAEPSPNKFYGEYDVEKKTICFKYYRYSLDVVNPLSSQNYKLDEIIESVENKFKYGNSKLQD